VRRVADKKAYTVHTMNITSQWQYFTACCLMSYLGTVLPLHGMCICFPSTHKLVMLAKHTV
jgi:hypothetical protein